MWSYSPRTGSSAFCSARSADHRRQCELSARQVDRRYGQVDLALDDHVGDRRLVHQHVEHRPLQVVGVDPLAHGQVRLRVEINSQHPAPALHQRDPQIQRRCCLGNPALLVREGDDLTQSCSFDGCQFEDWCRVELTRKDGRGFAHRASVLRESV
jgi:hypothetical protein